MLLNIQGVWGLRVYLLDARNVLALRFRRAHSRCRRETRPWRPTARYLGTRASRGAWVGACVAHRRWAERGGSSRAPCVDCT
ncbi:hypothetical protein BD310DRAFT_938178 [Dichomitus squalens]|uniref:Uncharacterized protein n=1 Tax=Dichomitus squalens TaxID=114155 RepID=A0A4Q9PG92_9APHY|nr:hypothetical protein BD310DRAFT_938178 [Dichomitus squalens]